MRKPATSKIREHVARVLEINKYLDHFPATGGRESEPLPEDELADILDYGNPNS